MCVTRMCCTNLFFIGDLLLYIFNGMLEHLLIEFELQTHEMWGSSVQKRAPTLLQLFHRLNYPGTIFFGYQL